MSRDFRAGLLVGVVISILVICAIGRFASVFADDWVVVSGVSYHFARNGQNERNTGLGREYRLTENNRLGFGAYNNSSNRFAAYLANGYTPYDCLGARCGVIGGLVTGYEQGQKPAILGGFVATLERGSVGGNLIFIPAAGGVLFLQGKFRW